MLRRLHGGALIGAIILGLSATTLPPTAVAEGERDLNAAVQRIRQDTGGRVLSAHTEREDGHAVHSIRILTREGRVKNFRVPAGNGKSEHKPRRSR